MRQEEKKQFVQAVFCAPTGAYEDKGYPDRLTDEVFSVLAGAGINRIFGFGYDSRQKTKERTFELCEKYGMKYYPVPQVKGPYTRVLPGPNGEKPYLELTEEERLELDKQLLKEVEAMSKHPSFGGIFFTDEAGYLSQDGIARAKRVFDTAYKDYEFHVNLFNYCVDDASFWGGFGKSAPHNVPFPLEGDLALDFKNRFNRYDILVEKLLSGAPFEYISQDIYPFENFWPTVPTSVHIGLFELNGYFNEKKKKYGNQFYNYMQVGDWVDYKTRRMNFAEMMLQMHVTAAYGSEGFAHFPGCFPLDWAQDPTRQIAARGGCALIDLDGKKTKFCDWLTEINTFFRAIEDDILSSEHLGVETFGIYKNGFSEDEIQNLRDNECIYRGNLPEMLRFESGLEIESENQVLVATFERDNKKRYYIVNLSSIYENSITIHLGEKRYQMTGLHNKDVVKGKVVLELDAAAGIYLQEM